VQPERAAIAIEPGERQPRRLGDEVEAATLAIASCIQAQGFEPILQAMQGQFVDDIDARTRAFAQGVERIERRVEAGLVLEPMHQRHQAFGQFGSQETAVALAAQDRVGAGEGACVGVAARAQQAAGPEFDVGRVDQQAGRGTHAAQLTGPARATSPVVCELAQVIEQRLRMPGLQQQVVVVAGRQPQHARPRGHRDEGLAPVA
jgi:hypothetical protein